MDNFWFYFRQFMKNSGGADLPIGFEFFLDGSLKLTGNATVWNDQRTNFMDGENLINYVLSEETFNLKIPFAIYKNNIWVKVSVKSGETVNLTVSKNSNASSNNDAVFELYDEFTEENSNKWDFSNSYVSNGNLIVNGGNLIYGAKSKDIIRKNSIIEWNMYAENGDFDSGVKIGNLFFVSDTGTGNQGIYTNFNYPSGSQQSGAWNDYRIILQENYQEFINLTLNKTVSASNNYTENLLQFICDSDSSSRPLKVDYICVRNFYNEEDIVVSTVDNGDNTFSISITNNGTTDYEGIQIPLEELAIDNYDIYLESISPVLYCKAFNDTQNSYLAFFTQFDHAVKHNSTSHFHIHCYIPPTATPGNIKLKLKWMTFPVEILVSGGNTAYVSSENKIAKEEIRVFEITEDMLGRHVLFDFEGIDTIKTLSQIVFHRLERLKDDAEDTFSSVLPILYVDWHTEMDSIGSQDEYKK